MAGALFVLPSLLILIALSWVYIAFGDVPLVAGLFYGIKPAVTAIVLQAAHRIGARALKNNWLWGIAGASFVAIFALNVPFPANMFALLRQVQIVSDSAKGCAARLAGVEVPSYADTEANFAELQERIARTVTFLKGLAPAQVDGSEGRPITLKMHDREVHFSGQAYLLNFALPNFYFHLTTAYGILRHNGVDIGKKDYLGEH